MNIFHGFAVIFLTVALGLPACGSVDPPGHDAGAACSSHAPGALACADVWLGADAGTAADLPAGSCAAIRWGDLYQCGHLSCASPCAGDATLEAPLPAACKTCVEGACAAAVASCKAAP